MKKMFEYPMEKYRFYFANNKVVAVSTFEGRTVRGVAKCDPKDTFDVESGKMLAAARCNQKVAEKRERRAKRELGKAVKAYEKARDHMRKMDDYYKDSRVANAMAGKKVDNILASM